jgi:VIT1/CCC1 family predicted Fe2+/Mn2+ transporter
MFATALGVSDGILNALTLASARVLRGVGLDLELGVRVGVVAFSSAVVTLFVAEYAQNRLELVRAERQLMFTRSGRLAATHLGRAVLRDAAVVAGVAGLSSFAGAALPLVVGAVLPKATWIALVASVAVLGALGTVLSLQVGGRRLVWTLGLVLAGIAVTIIGVQVDLV